MTARDNTEVYETERFRGHGDTGPATEWRFRVKGANGEIIAMGSEGYVSKANAERGLRALRRALLPGGPPPCDCAKGNPLP